jgi:hypothetical protein
MTLNVGGGVCSWSVSREKLTNGFQMCRHRNNDAIREGRATGTVQSKSPNFICSMIAMPPFF